MPIQRQSDQFSVFDTGTRWERDRPQHDLPRGLAGLVNGMGPRITGGMLNTRTAGTGSYPTPEHLWEGQGPSHDENGRHLRNSTPSEVEHFRDVARALREHHHIGGWHYPDRRDWTDHDPADDFYDDGRPSASELAEEDAERERERRERLEDEGYLRRVDDEDPDRFVPGSFVDPREARRRTAGGYEDIYFPGLSDDIEPSPEYVQKLRQHGIKPVDANYMGRELMDQYGLERPTRLRNLRNRALRDGWKPENFEIAVMNRLERGKQAPGCPECESEGSQCVRHYNYGVNLTRGYLHEPGDNPFEQVEDEDGNVLYEPRYKTKNPVKRVVPPYVEPPADPNSPRGIDDAAEGAEDEDEFRQLARLAAHARRLASRGSGRLPFDRQAGRRPDWRREWAPFSGIPYDPDRDDSREFAVGYRVRHRDNPDQLGHVEGIVLSEPKPGEQRKILIRWDDGNEAFHPMDEINRAPRWEGDTKYGAKGKCECWEGYERVPGTEPCADGSCRKKKSALRRLTAQMSYEDAMAHIDEVLAGGENHDLHRFPGTEAEYARGARSSGAPGPHLLSIERHLVDEDYRDEQLDAGTHLLNPELAHEVHPSERQAIDRMHEVAQGWGCEVNEYDPDEDSPEPPQPDVRYFQFDGPEEGEVQGYAELRPHTGHHTAAAPVQDPAAMAPQMPSAGGYQPGHRVGLPWRDEVVRGTVIGLDGDQPAIRWDDGQYSTEETRNILPL